jgi:hypothetical protein
LRPAILAIIALTCAEYVMVPVFDDDCGVPPSDNIKLTCATVLSESQELPNQSPPMLSFFVVILMAVNCYSVQLANGIQVKHRDHSNNNHIFHPFSGHLYSCKNHRTDRHHYRRNRQNDSR